MITSGGYLYIIHNPAFGDSWYKVGTTKNLNDRLFTYQTGDPLRRYEVKYSLFHPKFRIAEQKIKDTMKPFAFDIKNEWFNIPFHMAESRLVEQLEEFERSDGKY